MTACARTYRLEGLEARPVTIEVDVHRGLPAFSVVGLPDTVVRESRERVRAALVNSGFEFPLKRIIVNLAPASLRKAGPGMDLAIAAGLLVASGQLDWNGDELPALVGELALDGTVRSIRGVLPIAEAARGQGQAAIAVPAANGAEAALATGIEVLPVDHLGELSAIAAGDRPTSPSPLLFSPQYGGGPDLADLRGQLHLRHALEVAAAGGHSLLMIGPPGAGKSLAASRLPSILPPSGRARRPAIPGAASHDQRGRTRWRRQPTSPRRGNARTPRGPLPG
jgi:magnesium chelatase family protein